MLIINADDYGIEKQATDNILTCYKEGRITSATAMVFMEDSERAASLALDQPMDIGLHLNLTDPYSGKIQSDRLLQYHNQICSFLNYGKYSNLLYNPLLKNQFQYVYAAQYDEFLRLYKKNPTHIDGHYHVHLCANMLIQRIIDRGTKIRTTFSVRKNEKNPLNQAFRIFIRYLVQRRFLSTDYLFALGSFIGSGNPQSDHLREIMQLALTSSVELIVHPQKSDEYNYIMGKEFASIISGIQMVGYEAL